MKAFRVPRLYTLLLTILMAMLVIAGMNPVMAQSDAYSIEVAVSERGSQEEQDAYLAGLRRVLLNNSGDKTLLNRDLIRQELNNAENYVKEFSYRRPPPGTVIESNTPITPSVQRSGQATQLMLVSFDRELVNQLIAQSAPTRQAGEDAEPEPAPVDAGNSALVWILIQDEGRDIFISDPVANNVRNRAREIAGAAGISLTYPTGDEEDLALITLDDISAQSFDPDNLAAISQRYAQGTILIGYLSRNGAQGWLGQWNRVIGQDLQQSQFESSSLDQALQQGLSMLSSVAQIDESFRYGGTSTSDTEGLVWVGSLDSTEDYARMMRFFSGISAIGTVYPKEVQSNSMVFSVIPRSALVDIESALSSVGWLQRTSTPLTSDLNSPTSSADLAIVHRR